MPIYIWYPSIAGLTMGFTFMNIPPVADQFMELFGVGYGGLAFFLSGIVWTHALSQIPAGMVVDRLGVFRILLTVTFIGAAANWAPLLAPGSLALAVGCRFVLGLCTGLFFLSLMKILGFLAPPEKMARAQGIYGGVFGFGNVVPYIVLPHLGPQAWQYAYGVAGGLFFLSFLCAFLLPRERLRLPKAGRGGEGISILASLAAVARSKPIWALGVIHGLAYGTMNNLGQWLPSLLADLSGAALATWAPAAIAVLATGSAARSLSGAAAKTKSRAAVVNWSVLCLAVFYILIALSGWTWSTLALGLVLAFLSGVGYGTIFTLGSYVLPPVYIGLAIGLLNMTANLANILLTLLLGNVREHTGSFRAGFVVAGAAAAAVWLACRGAVRRVDRDIET